MPTRRKRVPSTLRLMREAQGLTQAEFGEKVGFDQSMVSFFERGDIIPAPPTLKLMAAALGYAGEPDDLLLPIPDFLKGDNGRKAFDDARLLKESRAAAD